MKTIVTYQSKTSFTKKYAEWISQKLSCELMELKNDNIKKLQIMT